VQNVLISCGKTRFGVGFERLGGHVMVLNSKLIKEKQE
jgi:hypothetical protein